MEVTIKCDRCGKSVKGLLEVSAEGFCYTGGFYDVDKTTWAQFANYGEKKVCDDCMHSDPKYRAIYSPE